MELTNKTTNKNFGIIFSIFFLILSIYPFLNEGFINLWFLFISFIFLILGLTNSNILSPLNKLWFIFGVYLGKFVSPVVMGIVFFLIVTPISFTMKILGKDILALKRTKKKSYWIEKNSPTSKMKNQF
tara:strand:+ start:1233 stop:1616 length:384 start_codon:yes stop_codon:yes gene_type:complete